MSATSRTNALTALVPLAPWRLWWCRLVLPVLRILATSSSLARLRSIHFGGWIVFGDVPGMRRHGWRSRPSMLFLSNYDGQLDEYLAAFGIAVAPGMRWSFGSAEQFPGTRPTRRFVDYVQRRRIAELVTYSAYPERTVRDVDTALAASDRVDQLRRLAETGSDIHFGAAYRDLVDVLTLAPEPPVPGFWPGLWQALTHRSTVSGVVVALPVEPGRADQQQDLAGRLAAASEPSPFERAGGVHFARLAVLDVAGRSGTTAEYLLLAAWVDGRAGAFLPRLVAALGDGAATVFGACAGYPGASDPDALVRWIAAHRLRISLFVGSRSGVSVDQVRAALDRWEQAVGFVDRVQGRPLAEVRHELEELWP